MFNYNPFGILDKMNFYKLFLFDDKRCNFVGEDFRCYGLWNDMFFAEIFTGEGEFDANSFIKANLSGFGFGNDILLEIVLFETFNI